MKRNLWPLVLICFIIFFLIWLFTTGKFLLRNFTGIGPVPVRSAFAGRLQGTIDGDDRRFHFFLFH